MSGNIRIDDFSSLSRLISFEKVSWDPSKSLKFSSLTAGIRSTGNRCLSVDTSDDAAMINRLYFIPYTFLFILCL